MTDMVAGPRLLIGFDLSKAGQWDSEHKDTGKVQHNYQWNQAQWRYIERSAFRMLLATMDGTAPWAVWEDASPPEALDYWEDEVPEGLFKASDDENPDEDEHLMGVSTAIGVVDAIISQFEEEAAKRDG
jgi:hypothetical protein